MTFTYHIRNRMPRNRGNSFYLDRSYGHNGTVCGAELTDHDAGWADRKRVDSFGEWVPCETCKEKANA